MRRVSTATCTSADPVSPLKRACSWMISCLASLVSVMVAGQGYQHHPGPGCIAASTIAEMSFGERLGALCGVLGPAAFTAAWLVAQRRQDEYQVRHEHISGLAAKDATDPSVMTAGFMALGGSSIAFASALERRLGPRPGRRPALGGVAGGPAGGAGACRRDRAPRQPAPAAAPA